MLKTCLNKILTTSTCSLMSSELNLKIIKWKHNSLKKQLWFNNFFQKAQRYSNQEVLTAHS